MNVIMVDNEYLQRKRLRYFIETYTDMNIMDEFNNGLDVLDFIKENTVDAIFLDTNIHKLDGITLAKIIYKFEKRPKVIFITSYEDYAKEAFDLEIFDYILKPYSSDRIIKMLYRLQNTFNTKRNEYKLEYKKFRNKISLWKNKKIYIVDVNDIYYCEARGRYTRIFTQNNEYEIRTYISDVEKIINNNIFFRSHRSYLVNLQTVEEIIPWCNNTYILKLNKGKYEIPVSRSRRKIFKQFMNI